MLETVQIFLKFAFYFQKAVIFRSVLYEIAIKL